jgi:hypothetical protein
MSNNNVLAGVAAATLLAVAPAQAASVSYFMDLSNDLPDGTAYLQVTISDGTDGAIDFLVEVLGPLTDIAGGNFGIQKFAFNVADGFNVTAANITGLPSGWSLGNGQGQMSAFGSYDIVLQGKGNSRQDPLSFSITGIDGDSVLDYVALAGPNNNEGDSFFAAHVAGFNWSPSTTSAFFGGATAVPVPATAWLLLSGIATLGWRARRRSPSL